MIQYATIGTGWIVDSFIAATRRIEGLALSAVYSRDKERALQFAQKHRIETAYIDLEEMASSNQIDAVYIASPNACHVEQSKLFLQHKKHVICEKPIAPTKKEAEELYALAKENGVIFMEAIIAIHSPQRKILEDALNEIGKISMARFDYSQLSSKYPLLQAGENPNIFNIDMKTGCVMDIGIYCAYLALLLFPKYETISAQAVKLLSSLDISGATVLGYPDKTIVLTYSKIADGKIESEIQGDRGTIVIDMVSLLKGITLHKKGEAEKTLFQLSDNVLPMQYEAESFYRYITEFPTYKSQYEQLSQLSILVAETLEKIRQESGVGF